MFSEKPEIFRFFYPYRNVTGSRKRSMCGGKNVNIATGCTIGVENRGIRKGCPKIGNCVWIGSNSVIVGNISIGDDVLIAPLTFVNFDVPSHSIVIGNPARIIYRENATDGYINNVICEE